MVHLFSSFRSWIQIHHVKVVLLALIAILVVATAYGLVFFITSQPGPKATITSPPLEFSIELDKAEYQYGENISIKFCLRNISNNTVTIGKATAWPIDPRYNILFTEANEVNLPEHQQHFLSRYFHFGFSITHQNGTEIFKQSIGRLLQVYDMVIQPGGYIKQTLIWGKSNDYPMPKGTYQIRGIFSFGMHGQSFTLETPNITITIN